MRIDATHFYISGLLSENLVKHTSSFIHCKGSYSPSNKVNAPGNIQLNTDVINNLAET